MPYLVMVIGTVALVLVWVTYAQKRSQVRKISADPNSDPLDRVRGQDQLAGRTLGSVLGSAVILYLVWSWGVNAIQMDAEQTALEQRWFATYVAEHERKWNEDCEALFGYFDSPTVLQQEAGREIDVAWCRDQWSPPEIPDEYTADRYMQPRYAQPQANRAIFGPDLFDWVCTPLGDCYSWDDFVEPPPGFF